jgi:VWFA-related protein
MVTARTLAALAWAVSAVPASPQEPAPRVPGVSTARVLIEARVLDGSGRPLLGLAPSDFRLEVDGRATPLESAVWVADAPEAHAAPPAADAPFRSEGRLVVLLFQKDFAASRLRGLLGGLGQAKDLVAPLGPRDRVAVLTYDSHLRLHLDFTADREVVRRAIDESLLQWPKPLAPGPAPSLAAHLDPARALAAASPEQALLALAEALSPLPGTKTVLLFGWGLGRLIGGSVVLDADYGRARQALDRARATVFCLDVTDADWHSLETGLRQVAADTGGQYFKVHETAAAALRQVGAALAGHYLLAFEPPAGPRGEHRVSLSLARRGGTVLARGAYAD